MSYYKYYITLEKEGYKFGLYPNNNNHQWVIISNAFETSEKAEEQRRRFQSKVVVNGEKAFVIEKMGVGKYLLRFLDDEIEVKYVLGNTYLCKKKMRRIIKNINAPLKVRED